MRFPFASVSSRRSSNLRISGVEVLSRNRFEFAESQSEQVGCGVLQVVSERKKELSTPYIEEVAAEHAANTDTQDTFSKSTSADQPPVIRCAIYARYPSDLQRPTAIEDQLRNCRRAADEKGWIVMDDFIQSDSVMAGRTVVGREGLVDLTRFAKQRPRPFDLYSIDDTSRLGRYLPDALRECDLLKYYGVVIYFVCERLENVDSPSPWQATSVPERSVLQASTLLKH